MPVSQSNSPALKACRTWRTLSLLLILCGVVPAQRPDGLYAEIRTSKGLIVARLELDLTPLTVANFVGLAEGAIANTAFDSGRPFFDGSLWHRVVPGHVIQAGMPESDRARGPGYNIPNEIHAKLSHNHAGALGMANSGPNTNSSQFYITLADRSYLDGNYSVFGEVVQGLDVVRKIVQGDSIESLRIVRIGAKAEAFHPTTESFEAMLKSAQERVAAHVEKRTAAEREWIAHNYPKAAGPDGGVLSELLTAGQTPGALRIRYRARQLRYVGDVIGRDGPAIDALPFVSGPDGAPSLDSPAVFDVARGQTRINSGLDGVLANMSPGERRVVIVPAALAYGRQGFYAPEVPGKPRLVISPNATIVYEVEALVGER